MAVVTFNGPAQSGLIGQTEGGPTEIDHSSVRWWTVLSNYQIQLDWICPADT